MPCRWTSLKRRWSAASTTITEVNLGPDWKASSGPMSFHGCQTSAIPFHQGESTACSPPQHWAGQIGAAGASGKPGQDSRRSELPASRAFQTRNSPPSCAPCRGRSTTCARRKTLTEQVGDLLDLLIPGDGDRLFALGDWHHTPALESEIIEWLTGDLEAKEGSRAKRGNCCRTRATCCGSRRSTCSAATGGWRSPASAFTRRRPTSTDTGRAARAGSRPRQSPASRRAPVYLSSVV